MTSIRDLVAQAGLPHDASIRDALPGLTWHTCNPLADAGITTVGRLAEQTDIDLLALPGVGGRRLDALRAELQRVAREQARPSCWCAEPGRTEEEMYQCPAGDAGEECLAHDYLAAGGALHMGAPFYPRVDLSNLRQAAEGGAQ